MKVCVNCGEVRSLTEYDQDTRKPDGLREVCRECQRERNRRWYRQNKARHLANVKARQEQTGRPEPEQSRPRRQEHPSEAVILSLTKREAAWIETASVALKLSRQDYLRALVQDAMRQAQIVQKLAEEREKKQAEKGSKK